MTAKTRKKTEAKKLERPPLMRELEEALRKIPPEKLAEAKRRVDQILKEKNVWAELFALPPEKLREVAQVGYEQFKSGGYAGAEKIFKGLTVIDPENDYYRQMLGAAYQRQEKYPEAVLEYSIAADLNPRDVVSLTNRGESYMKLGIHPLALEDFDKAIALDNTGTDRWANRARMLKEQIKLMKEKK